MPDAADCLTASATSGRRLLRQPAALITIVSARATPTRARAGCRTTRRACARRRRGRRRRSRSPGMPWLIGTLASVDASARSGWRPTSRVASIADCTSVVLGRRLAARARADRLDADGERRACPASACAFSSSAAVCAMRANRALEGRRVARPRSNARSISSQADVGNRVHRQARRRCVRPTASCAATRAAAIAASRDAAPAAACTAFGAPNAAHEWPPGPAIRRRESAASRARGG